MQNSYQLHQHFKGDISLLFNTLKLKKQIITIAHRGGISAGYPENSMATIQRTLNAVPVLLEVDIMTTADGVDVLHHDNYLERTTTGFGSACQLTWREMSQVQLKDQSNRIMNMGLVRFDDFLTAVAKKTFLILDMKAPTSYQSIVARIKQHDMLKATVFIAYSLEQAQRIRQMDCHAVLALGVNNATQLAQISALQLASTPLMALMGDSHLPAAHFRIPELAQHCITVGSYLGDDPLDAKIELGSTRDILLDLKNKAINAIVSNQPIAMHNALQNAGLSLSI
ncbi:glycerophosphodiester phosphodiesterase family protein [Rheinheimera gaetbuli]